MISSIESGLIAIYNATNQKQQNVRIKIRSLSIYLQSSSLMCIWTLKLLLHMSRVVCLRRTRNIDAKLSIVIISSRCSHIFRVTKTGNAISFNLILLQKYLSFFASLYICVQITIISIHSKPSASCVLGRCMYWRNSCPEYFDAANTFFHQEPEKEE